ncbi:MAG TPA: glycosyltransferase [Actinomycetota bacterium]|nr:glycosyltransferase [Actinomycetota bacterium]
MRVSVVIALDEDGISERHLAPIAEQRPAGVDLEVVMVDGTQPERTRGEALAAIRALDGRLDARFVEHSVQGRAAAVNRGLAETTAPLVVLVGNDFVPQHGWLAAHLDLHRRRPEPHVAGIGPALFPAELRTSPFLRWLEDSGRLFGVSFTRPDLPLLGLFFYGANTSLKRGFLERAGAFSEAFPGEAWDDYDVGERLFAAGMEVTYLPDAVCLHEHRITVVARREQMRRAGTAAAIMERVRALPAPWNELVRVEPGRLRRSEWKRRLWAALTRSARARAAYYRALTDRAFVDGYRRERRT